MGVSTLSNRTIKLNKSDEEDSKEEKAMPTIKPHNVQTPKPQAAKVEGSMYFFNWILRHFMDFNLQYLEKK